MENFSDHLSFDFAKTLISHIQAVGFDAAEVIVSSEHVTEMQVDFSDISLLRNSETDLVRLRGIMGGRYATVSINQLDSTSLQTGVVRLQEAAMAAPIDPHRSFAPNQLVPHNEMGPLEPLYYLMHDRVSQFLRSVSDAYPECMLKQSILRYTRTRTLRLNTQGLEADTTEASYNHGVRFLSKRNGKTSSINYSGAYAENLDTELLDWPGLRRAIESSGREIAVAPFVGQLNGPIVISPEAFGVLLGFCFAHLRDEKMLAGTSQFRQALEKPISSPLLTIEVEPRSLNFARHEFLTEDGYGAEPSTLIEKGVLKAFMLTDHAARKLSLERAVNSGTNLVVLPGPTPLERFFADVKYGLYLGRVSGGAPAINGDFSIVAKNSFLIEDGVLTRPVSEVIVSGNLFEMLNAIADVSQERANDGITCIPWVRVNGLTANGRLEAAP